MSTAFPADVDVAVVSHNGRRTLSGVFDALTADGAPADRITLYDIASTDETAAWVAAERPGVRVVRLDRNDGPNPARNRAIADASRPYVLLVDSDARVLPGSIVALAAAIRVDRSIGATVPVVVDGQHPDRIQYAGARLHFICEAINPWLGRPLVDRGPDARDIGTAPGVTFLLCTSAARAVGAFDERYFMGKEDGEFCYRLRLAGYRIVETPAAVACHDTKPRSTWLYRYQIRNRWHFMLKNYERRTLLVLAPALAVHEVLQLVLLAAQGELAAWGRAVAGLVRLLPSLAADRRAVAAVRRAGDGTLLDAAPLVVRADVVGAGAGAAFKRAYDAWLTGYWRLMSPLLSRRRP